MNIFSGEGITKSYGTKQLFNEIDFHIGEDERIGIIGVNGTGKSSLLKLIAGVDEPDAGTFVFPRDYRIGYLPQDPEMTSGLTLIEQVFEGDATAVKLMQQYEKAVAELQEHPEDASLQDSLFELQKKMDAENAWEVYTNAETILTKLGLTDTGAIVDTLSGGQKKRVALAQVLIETPDLLILDEPTNHLDFESIAWLGEFLGKYPKSVVVVTHDRYFLDQVANRIFELDHGKLYSYPGNYQDFIEAKAVREEEEQSAEAKRRNLYRRELAWMRRGAKARSTKQKARIQRFDTLQGDLGKVPAKEQVDISTGTSRLGKQVFELKEASKRFGGRVILDDFSLLIKPGARIGIAGKNGSGKSTLLNILAGRTELDEGELIRGQTVSIAYYTQENEGMDENKRMIAYLREAGEAIETNTGEVISAAQMLERFLFPPNSHGTLISKLSGGEKRRLYLLKLLMQKPNVLLMDEPTNDLDTATLTVLENYIEEFKGVVISVSHDRYFLDKTAEELLIFDGEGKISRFMGLYSDYLEAEKLKKAEPPALKPAKKQEPKKEKEKKKTKLTFSEQKEWDGIEEKIEKAETDLAGWTEELEKAGADFEKAQELTAKIDSANEELEKLIERWTYLSEYAD